MKKTILLMSSLFVMLISADKSKSRVIIWNNANWPIMAWPIPSAAPPKLLAKIPPKRQGIHTAPAELIWPTDANSIIFVGEPLFEEFDKMLDEMLEESKGNPDYDWTKQMDSRLQAHPRTDWVIMYPGLQLKLNELTAYTWGRHIVVWNVKKQTELYASYTSQPDFLMSLSQYTLGADKLHERYPYPDYEGIPSK